MPQTRHPVCLAMMLAENIYVEPGTEKKAIIGTITSFWCEEFPATFRFSVYAALINGGGPTRIDLVLTDGEDDNKSWPIGFVMAHFPDPIKEVELMFRIDPMNLIRPGAYRIQLMSGERCLAERRLNVNQLPSPSGDQPSET